MNDNKRKVVNDSVYNLAQINPGLRKNPDNDALQQAHDDYNNMLLEGLGLGPEDLVDITKPALDYRVKDAKKYLDILYEDCRKYKRGDIENGRFASDEILKEYIHNPHFSSEIGLTIGSLSIELNALGKIEDNKFKKKK